MAGSEITGRCYQNGNFGGAEGFIDVGGLGRGEKCNLGRETRARKKERNVSCVKKKEQC